MSNLESKVDIQNESQKSLLKIQYFPFNGRAYPLRLAGFIGDIKFDDEFISFKDFRQSRTDGNIIWAGMPQAIIIENNKKYILSQSNSILRYIGKKTGLYPKNDILAALVDGVMDACEDVQNMLAPSMQENDKDKKLEMRKQLLKKDSGSKGLLYWYQKFDDRLNENEKRGCNNGFFVGNSLTVADLKAYTSFLGLISGNLDGIPKDTLKPYKKVSSFVDMMSKNNKIKSFDDIFKKNQTLYKKDNKNKIFTFNN
mmetsp:Transcript_97961/g.119982  ORF Transcript_97961/g.119982 Transcript_97961/m.119982 type:complete len:255 (-) Transcript_97961:24-788(-)